MRSYFFYFDAIEFENMKFDSHLAACGGVVLQQFELIINFKVCLKEMLINIIAEIVIFGILN